MGGGRNGKGLVLGKFLPPHAGHEFLVDFARGWAEDVSVVVGTLAAEPIPGTLRHSWMSRMFPDCRVLHLAEELPQHPDEHPDFWRLWKDALESVLPWRPDFVFASEDYGAPLAALFDAEFVPVDVSRSAIPVSGTKVRADPMGNWRFLPKIVRPHFLKRVRILGAESTGKSVLADRLAARFQTTRAEEYAKGRIERAGGRIAFGDIEHFAKGQLALESACARAAEKVLVCDGDLTITAMWSNRLFGACPEWIEQEAAAARWDLTLVSTPEGAPGIDDVHRVSDAGRREFHEELMARLGKSGGRVEILGGSWEERFEAAAARIEALIAPTS